MIVGLESPSGKTILQGAGARRLAALAGLDDLTEVFWCVNLRQPGADSSDDESQAEVILDYAEARGIRRLILLGREVAGAFGVRYPSFEFAEPWNGRGGVRAASIPHPSGRNRFWNDPARTDYAARFMRRVAATS